MFVPTLDAGAAFIPANDCPHCLASIASPALRAVVTQTAEDAAPADLLVSGQPDWLSLCPHGAVTGRILMMRDDYGTRFAVLAECGYPGGVDPHVFSFDIDACSVVDLAGAAVFDSVDEAASAWRASKGDTARTALPELVREYGQLDCLVQSRLSPDGPFRGAEPRAVAENVFRASRRAHDVARALAEPGQRQPAFRNLYCDREDEIEAAAKRFGAWHEQRHGSEPSSDVVLWLAADWLEGTLPCCVSGVSPHRVKDLMSYMKDTWLPGEPAITAALELLPEWIRWNGEQADVPGQLIERAVAVAQGHPPNADECPPFTL